MNNTESTILVGATDHLDPEVNAMVLAMYSRNNEPILDRLPSTEESTQQHKEKLGKFYIGYNHRSIGQCGTTTVFFENVSQLAAKALENHPLYNGQECSSRYIDFSNQPMYSNDEEISKWQEMFRTFYIKALPLTIEKIKREYPFNKDDYVIKVSYKEASNSHPDTTNVFIDEKLKYTISKTEPITSLNIYFINPLDGNSNFKDIEYNTFASAIESIKTLEFTKKINSATTIWENTCKARAFDICRGILPAGVTTSLAFTGTFDTLNDHLGEMLYHPSKEMRDIAKTTLIKMKEVYPYATKEVSKLKEEFSYANKEFFYQKPKSEVGALDVSKPRGFVLDKINLPNRKKFEKIPRFNSNFVRFKYCNTLDFGSYRDIHRHRNGYINMPLLDTSRGFEFFYLDNLPLAQQTELLSLLQDYAIWYSSTTYLSDIDKQYCTPMGYKCVVEYECDLNQMLYLFELRSGKTVHQTLRKFMHDWINKFNNDVTIPFNIKIHPDMDEDNFSLRRGEQTFIKS